MTASDEGPEVLEAIRMRMFGTGSGHTSQEALQEYIRKHANSSADIVSFHARWLASQLANSNMMASVAHRFLAMCIERNDQIASDERALRRLTDELAKHAKQLVEHAWTDDEPVRQVRLNGCRITGMQENSDGTVTLNFGSNETAVHSLAILPSEEDGMLRPDARLAAYVENLGSNGSECAGRIRKKACERWASALAQKTEKTKDIPDGTRAESTLELWGLWLNPDDIAWPLWVQALAQVLWLDVVKPGLEKPPALVCQVHDEVVKLHSRSFKQEESNGQRRLRLVDGSTAELLQPDPNLPAFELGVLDTLLDRGLVLLGSVTAHKLLRWEVWQGHAQHMQKAPKANIIEVVGGWSGIAHELGLKTKKSADDVHAVIATQAHCRFVLPDGTCGNMLSYLVTPARGQRSGCVSLSLGAMLMPDYLFELRARMGEGRALREAQRLVPVVECPPFVGRANDHGQQATLSMSVVREMRARACEMVERGGVLISLDRFADLARASALPARLIGAVIDRWTQDGDDGPAFLERVEQDRYTLGKAHSVAKTFIEEAGRIELTASARGKQSVTNRKHQIILGNKRKTARGK